jgi:GTP pyrophosphokinase
MNEIAEKGIAAHWAYKKDGFVNEQESEMDKWITRVKDILVNPDVNALDLLDMIHNDLIRNDIFVFTPRGEQKMIEKGATALDFAYSIHTEVGNKAIAAKVNLRLMPLSYVLKTGDQVEIITAEKENPKREWLQFVKTSKARKLIIDYMKSQRQSSVALGKSMLEDSLKIETLVSRFCDGKHILVTDTVVGSITVFRFRNDRKNHTRFISYIHIIYRYKHIDREKSFRTIL